MTILFLKLELVLSAILSDILTILRSFLSLECAGSLCNHILRTIVDSIGRYLNYKYRLNCLLNIELGRAGVSFCAYVWVAE